MYAQQSKAKRLKYEQAMEAFKNSLVKVAVRKMIIVADRRSQMRIKLATDRHTQVSNEHRLTVSKFLGVVT